jgi:hypothetical protein
LKELIIDTHILLWWLGNDALLSQTARDLISDPENVICVSAASIWEAAIKRKLGKLSFEDIALFRGIAQWGLASVIHDYSTCFNRGKFTPASP